MNEGIFSRDISNCLDAIEDYIIREEQHLIDTNAGDVEWCKLDKYKITQQHLQFINSLYGHDYYASELGRD